MHMRRNNTLFNALLDASTFIFINHQKTKRNVIVFLSSFAGTMQ